MLEFTSWVFFPLLFFVSVRCLLSFTCTYSTDLKYSWQNEILAVLGVHLPWLRDKKREKFSMGWNYFLGRVVQWESEDQDLNLHPKCLYPTGSVGMWESAWLCISEWKKKIINSCEHIQVTWESQGGSRPRAMHWPTFAPLEIGLHWGRSGLNSWLSANPWHSESLGIFFTNSALGRPASLKELPITISGCGIFCPKRRKGR